jgi:hypothetical protein
MNGVALAARYSFPPNTLGYCGTNSFQYTLAAYLSGKPTLQILEKELKKFRAHYAYLSLIARENSMKPFDMEVVRAFWIGNDLLENVSSEALREFIVSDLFAGKQLKRARSLSKNLPNGLNPHHSFNSLYINFITDRVERTIENYDACCVTLGEVLSVSAKFVKVNRSAITLSKEGKLALKERFATVLLERNGVRFVKDLVPGDIISVHWGMAIEKLKATDVMALKKYTLENITVLNNFSNIKHNLS